MSLSRIPFLSALRHNPVVVSELRTRIRGRRAFVVLGAHLFVLSSLALIIYAIVYQETQAYTNYYYSGGYQQALQASANLGKAVFYGIVFLLLFIVSLVGPAFTSSSIAGEKERQTYDLLVITTLPARAIVTGKLNAVLVFMGLLILATLPFLSMAYFFGGVALGEILIATLILLLTALLFCSLGIFVSSFARSTTMANIFNFAIVIPLLLGVPIFLFLFGIFEFFDSFFFSDPPLIIAGMVAYFFLFLLSINPLSMAVLSQVFLDQTGSYFFAMESIFGDDPLLIISPWVIYTVFSLVTSFILIRMAVARVERVSQS